MKRLKSILFCISFLMVLQMKSDVWATEVADGTTDATTTVTSNTGWDSEKSYYYVDGVPVKGAFCIDNKLYLFDDTGKLYKKSGLKEIEGSYYYFNKDYSLNTGVVKVQKKYYYFSKKTGQRFQEKGIHKVDGKYYNFSSKYNLKKGWTRDGDQNRYYFDKNTYEALTGWNYVGKYKYYFNKKGQLSQDVRKKLTKQQKKSYLIKVNRTACCVTVYAKDGKKGYTIPVVSFVCSTGGATPTGTFKLKEKMRWHELFGPCWGQWCTRIVDNILFHSVYYNRKNDKYSLAVGEYNKLGTMASHGCVRLTAGDAKWIYDNCKSGTKVIIYNNEKDPGPFDKPKAKKLKSSQTWDPTDPTIKK